MEMILEQDSPLALYLEGKGHNQNEQIHRVQTRSNISPPYSFSSHRKAPIHSLSHPGKPKRWPAVVISKIQDGYARGVSSTLGRADNERFLEHFRYIIIASQLLNEHVGAFLKPYGSLDASESQLASPLSPGTLWGVFVSTLLAFGFVWLIHWAQDANPGNVRNTRFLFAFSIQSSVAILLYAFVRRHWLKYLRRQAVESATKFVEEVQLFEGSSSSILKQIQEIEVVSRGYQISRPLPPISRLEIGERPRTCHHLRRSLRQVYDSSIIAFLDTIHSLRPHIDDDDFHRFLNVYNVQAEDALASQTDAVDKSLDELDSLIYLRELQYRFSALRRLLLCSLLSIPATGRKEDRTRWRTCVAQMTRLSALLNESSQRMGKLLLEEENVPLPSPLIGSSRPSSSGYNPHLTAFVIQLRTLHAKLHLVRSDVGRLTSTSSSIIASDATRDQFNTVGTELKALLQTWELGRGALDDLLTDKKKEFDHSVAGLGVILDVADEPTEVQGEPGGRLQLPNGALPASPPLSAHSGSGDEVQGFKALTATPPAETEVFEAMSQPRRRPNLTREQRIVKMQEDREKQAKTNEKREASSNMIKELQAVINLRPSAYRKDTGNKVTNA